MYTFETSATVQDKGQLHLAAVPFAPGTEVDIRVSAKGRPGDSTTASNEATLASARERMRELFKTVQGFKNTPRLTREDLYDR